MTEQPVAKQELESTPSELANSWLSYRASEVNKEMDRTEQSLKFEKSYQMESPGARPSNIEPGSMDASDWDSAEAEYNQSPDEQVKTINHLGDELQRLEGELGTITIYRGRVKEGDAELIEELSGYEKERREKLEKEKQETERMEKDYVERKAGKEMNGVPETEAVLKKLISLVETGSIPEDKPGKNGWELTRKWNNKMHDYIKNDFQIELRLKFADATGVHVDMTTYPGPILPVEKREKGRMDIGESVDFRLGDGKIYDWNKCKMVRSFQYGYPNRSSISSDESFTQSDLDSARNVISELYSDIESLSST
jgi:hypothetical protein